MQFASSKFLVIKSQNGKNGNKEKIVIYVITFDPVKILIGWAHQNDRQNLSFVKAINVVDRKMTRNTRKMANS